MDEERRADKKVKKQKVKVSRDVKLQGNKIRVCCRCGGSGGYSGRWEGERHQERSPGSTPDLKRGNGNSSGLSGYRLPLALSVTFSSLDAKSAGRNSGRRESTAAQRSQVPEPYSTARWITRKRKLGE